MNYMAFIMVNLLICSLLGFFVYMIIKAILITPKRQLTMNLKKSFITMSIVTIFIILSMFLMTKIL